MERFVAELFPFAVSSLEFQSESWTMQPRPASKYLGFWPIYLGSSLAYQLLKLVHQVESLQDNFGRWPR